MENGAIVKITNSRYDDYRFPDVVDWKRIDKNGDGFLVEVGAVTVDGASVTVKIILGGENEDFCVELRERVFTPKGDGKYRVLAGNIAGIGKCLIVQFDGDD